VAEYIFVGWAVEATGKTRLFDYTLSERERFANPRRPVKKAVSVDFGARKITVLLCIVAKKKS